MDPHWIATAFGAINSIRVLFYVPQIVAVVRSTDGARDIALSTWAMWALTNGLGAAYGAVVVHDALLALSFVVACVLTIALTLVQRLRWSRRRGACATQTGFQGWLVSQARLGLAACCPVKASRSEASSAAASAARPAARSTPARRRTDSARSTAEGGSSAATPASRSACSSVAHASAAWPLEAPVAPATAVSSSAKR